jgi:hypothetical protein
MRRSSNRRRESTMSEARGCSSRIALASDSLFHTLSRVEHGLISEEYLAVEITMERLVLQLSGAEGSAGVAPAVATHSAAP